MAPDHHLLAQFGSVPVDGGATFIRINDLQHQYGYINTITGDVRVFGPVFLGTAGRGIIEADSPN